MSHPAAGPPDPPQEAAALAAWYQVALSAIGDAVLTTDPAGRLTYLNPMAETLTGWSAPEALGRPLQEVLVLRHQATHLPVEPLVSRVIASGPSRGLARDCLLIGRDGAERLVDDSAAPVHDAAGALVGVVLVLRDVSEARRRERQVQDALAYAQSLIATVRDPLVVLDADLRVRSASRSFYQTFGVEPEATEGRLLYELGNGQWDIPALRTQLERVLPRDQAFRDFEVTHRFEGIGLRRMLLNGRKVHSPDDHREAILLAIEDVTPSWRPEVEFAANRERYRVIVEAATGFGIFTFDTQGVITSWNSGARTMMGYTEAEALGQNVTMIFTPEDVAGGEASHEMRTAATEGRALDERWHVRQGGERFWAQGLVMPLTDDADQIRGFVKIVSDRTPERRLQEALQARTAELERADAHKNEFLAMLAHELRNPLAAIRNAVSLAGRTDQPEDRHWSQEVIRRQVENFAHLIDDLLDVARINQGKVRLRPEPIDARPVIQHAVAAVRPLIDERRHTLTIDLRAPTLSVRADTTRLEQMLVNLLTNAARYTPPGGRITLSAEVDQGAFRCRVRDNGIGIAPEQLPRIFDLFAQGEGTLARSGGGLGIGLSLVRSLAELHGGGITATSGGPDQGSEFVLWLPSDAAPRPAEASRAPTSGRAAPSRLRLLVVDDSQDTARGLARLLTHAGHTVQVAHDGPTALKLARTLRPQVAILDIGLPGMDGYELADRLRHEPGGQDTVLLAVSGYGADRNRAPQEPAPFDQYLVKPVDIDRLLAVIATLRPAGN